MTGAGAYARIAKESGSWLWESAINVRTPGFENNDLAFLTRADYVWYNANVLKQWQTPTKWYRSVRATLGGQQQQNFSGDLVDRDAHVFLGTTTPQFWNSWDTHGGRELNLSTRANFRPTSNVAVSFGPSWNGSNSQLQYLTTVHDATATNFYGSRYVLSALAQKQIAFDTRLNVTFSPRMTLELYAQPFFASGHFDNFKEFIAPRQGAYNTFGVNAGTVAMQRDTAGVITRYTIDPDGTGAALPFSFANPDFSQQSLRGNAVFRWEYRPGSVVYFAWTHSRFREDGQGSLDFARERDALYSAHPDNVFLVKASWWIPR